MSEEIILDGRVLSAQTKYLIVHDKLIDAAIKLLNKKAPNFEIRGFFITLRTLNRK